GGTGRQQVVHAVGDPDPLAQERTGQPDRVRPGGQAQNGGERHHRRPPPTASRADPRALFGTGSSIASSPVRASRTGIPGGNRGVVSTAIAAPTSAARRTRPSRRAGSTSASSAAGNAASMPNASGSPSALLPTAPTSTETFQTAYSTRPQTQNAWRLRSGSPDRASAKAAVSSVRR